MLKYILINTCFLCAVYSHAQLSGTVIDAGSSQRLAFVHIGVIGKNMGTISTEDGSFSIDPQRFEAGDQITFSMIGYKRVTIPVEHLKDQMVVKLSRQSIQLKPVEISAEKIKDKSIFLGRVDPSKTTTGQSGTTAYGYGGEWGVEIDPKGEEYVLKKVRFHTRFNTFDSILFRVNLYSIQDGLPDTSLLRTEVLTKSYSGDNWIEADVAAQNLKVSSPFVASMELVRLWYSKESENYLFYTHSKAPVGRTFSKQSSMDNWIEGGIFPVTINVEVVRVEE